MGVGQHPLDCRIKVTVLHHVRMNVDLQILEVAFHVVIYRKLKRVRKSSVALRVGRLGVSLCDSGNRENLHRRHNGEARADHQYEVGDKAQ